MPDYFTPIPYGAPLDVDSVNEPLQELNDAIVAAVVGGQLEALNVGVPTELTINTGSITRNRIAHLVDTEVDASEDDLTTINGGLEGDIVILSPASASRVVVVKHGTGNIDLYSGVDERLDSLRKSIVLRYRDGRWGQLSGLATILSNYNSYRLPYGLPLMPHMGVRNRWSVRAAAATIQSVGIATPTPTGTLTASNETDSTYVNCATAASAGATSGFPTATYNLVRFGHNPTLRCLVRIVDVLGIRIWIGLASAAIGNVDTVAGATEVAAFRYSSVPPDAGWIPVTKDASTQNAGSALGTGTVLAGSRHLLEIECDSVAGVIRFRHNNGAPVVMAANLPALTTELGVNVVVTAVSAVARNFKFSRLEVEFD